MAVYILAPAIVFLAIPTCRWPAGFFGFCLVPEQVYRLIMGSSWFLIIPTAIFWSLKYFLPSLEQQKQVYMICLLNLGLILLCLPVSKYLCHGAFYANAKSITQSLDKQTVGVNYSPEDIQRFGELLPEPKSGKPALYSVRGDWAYLARCVYRKHVYGEPKCAPPDISVLDWYVKQYYQFSRQGNKRGMEIYKPYRDYGQYEFIDVQLPGDFPRDEKIFEHFPRLDKKSEMPVKVVSRTGTVGEITKRKCIYQSFRAHGKFSRVYLLLSTYGRDNTADITVKIKARDPAEKEALAAITVNASEIKDIAWYLFKFDPIEFDSRIPYFLTLESPGSCIGNAVTVYRSGRNVYKKGSLYINHKKTNYDLCVRIVK